MFRRFEQNRKGHTQTYNFHQYLFLFSIRISVTLAVRKSTRDGSDVQGTTQNFGLRVLEVLWSNGLSTQELGIT